MGSWQQNCDKNGISQLDGDNNGIVINIRRNSNSLLGMAIGRHINVMGKEHGRKCERR